MMGTRRPPVTFLLSLLCYALGIYSKESLLTFLPVFALSAWHVTPHMNKREWGRLLLALLPFGLVLASNVGLRFLLMGSLGGYTNVKIDTLSVFWSELAVAMRLMLSPINPLVMGNITEQVVAALASVAVLLGLVLYGRSVYRLLIVATAWLVLTLMPVLNLLGTPTDLQQNRFLYLASGAYCAVVAALFYSGYNALREGGRERAIMVGGAALCILLGIVTAWLQLRPWHTATAIASDIDAELQRLIPIEKRPKGVIWYTQDMPDNYQGAYIYRLGLGISRTFVNGDVPWIEPVIDATKPNLSTDSRDSYKIRFAYDAPSQRYHVSYLAGESTGTEPPTTEQAGDDLRVWDFRQCDPQMVGQWHSQEGRMQCRNDAGLQITTSNGDPQIIGPKVSLDLRASGARWLRVRVAARYPLAEKPEPAQNQIFWREPDDPWSGSASATFDIRQDGKTHIYWTFISPDQIETTLDYLRFDPVDGELPSDVRWVALDYVR